MGYCDEASWLLTILLIVLMGSKRREDVWNSNSPQRKIQTPVHTPILKKKKKKRRERVERKRKEVQALYPLVDSGALLACLP